MTESALLIIRVLFSAFISTFIIFSFMEQIFQRAYRIKVIYYLGFLGSWFLFLSSAFFSNTAISLLISITVIFGVGFWLYHVRKSSEILILCLFLIFLILTEFLGQTVISMIHAQAVHISHGDIFQSFLTFICYQMVLFFISKKRREFNYAGGWILLISVPAISLFLMYAIIILLGTQTGSTQKIFAGLGFLLLFVINLIVFTLFYRISSLNYENQQYQLLEQQKQYQYKHFQDLEENFEKSRKFFHDIKNHLATLEQLYQTENSAANAYSATIKDQIHTLQIPAASTNKIVNILIQTWISKTKEAGIRFIYNCEDINLDFLSDMDLNTILTNLLDNAFEECTSNSLKQNYIELSICQINHFIIINLSNSCESAPVFTDNTPVSRKQNHIGLGFSNIRTTVEKYHGSLDANYENQEFTVQITFFGKD